MEKVLIAEISGKRPGSVKDRPTERYRTKYDKVIISNNSEGYDTTWDIVNVPDDYREWYMANVKNSAGAWYAPMNRSYAIKYAREHGYKYLVQCDDNIIKLTIEMMSKQKDGKCKRYRVIESQKNDLHREMFDDFVDVLVTVLKNSNAVMSGMGMTGVGVPDNAYLRERYVYSFFALDLESCPDIFQGDFEDDIEYRLKAKQMGFPVLQVGVMKYGKTGQQLNKDLTGCREEYAKAGIKRGEHMMRLYGDLYTCKMRDVSNSINAHQKTEGAYFKHILKSYKVGTIISDKKAIDKSIQDLMKKYSVKHEDKAIVKEKKKR